MRIFIGADHRGFELKEKIKTWMSDNNIAFQDAGAFELDPNDDYPTYAEKVAADVSFDIEVEKESLGIIICGSGVGVDITANKYDGIRAGLGINQEQVISAKRDDNINILALAADTTDEHKAIEMVKAFIETPYENSEKHERRLEEIEKIEEDN